jgi:hypothetical protein
MSFSGHWLSEIHQVSWMWQALPLGHRVSPLHLCSLRWTAWVEATMISTKKEGEWPWQYWARRRVSGHHGIDQEKGSFTSSTTSFRTLMYWMLEPLLRQFDGFQILSVTLEPCMLSCRVVVTDHGDFVLINVYVPNAGEKGERSDFKCKFLRALKHKADSYRATGRKVNCPSINPKTCLGFMVCGCQCAWFCAFVFPGTVVVERCG